MLQWTITFILLSLVSGIFALGGTGNEAVGLVGRVAAVGFLVLAIVIFFTRHGPGGTGEGRSSF